MTKIVSRNYRDRSSIYAWLIRDETQNPQESRACKSVSATNVIFERSSSYEEGFGCRVIAKCEEATGQDFEVVVREGRLKFIHDTFYDVESGLKVHSASKVELKADGTVLATYTPTEDYDSFDEDDDDAA